MNVPRRPKEKKRIVFRLIGNNSVGMGHIYRSLSIAREMREEEVLFVCDTSSEATVRLVLDAKHSLGVYDTDWVLNGILELEPDVVINDILDTTAPDILFLKNKGIIVINFEDLGSGATVSDLTINELYDYPHLTGGNVLWGYKYFFVREEFEPVEPNTFMPVVSQVLLTFGGTDQHRMSESICLEIYECCARHNIDIHIVTGPGYNDFNELNRKLSNRDGVSLTHATGVMSRIMGQSQFAITSNGRTVYELAHLNVPAIVIPQHQRERTHSFATESNGFIPLDTYSKGNTEKEIITVLEKVISDREYRFQLYNRMLRYSFIESKHRVVEEIWKLIE